MSYTVFAHDCSYALESSKVLGFPSSQVSLQNSDCTFSRVMLQFGLEFSQELFSLSKKPPCLLLLCPTDKHMLGVKSIHYSLPSVVALNRKSLVMSSQINQSSFDESRLGKPCNQALIKYCKASWVTVLLQ